MSKDNILNEHLEFKRLSVKFEGKLKDIERGLKNFINSSKKDLGDFTEGDVIKYINELEKNYSVRTINDIKTYIKVFLKWYFEDWSSIFRNLEKVCKLKEPSRAYEPEDLISFEELERLVKGEEDLMWKVYWIILFYGGFRPSECCRLKWKDFLFEDKGIIIKLHTTKTNRDFYKSLPSNVEGIIKKWKEHNSSEFVFPSIYKERETIVPRSARGRLQRLSRRVLGRGVVPYALRHSIATELYKNDKLKDDDVARQMGHNKSMKAVYMSLNSDDLKAKARNLWVKGKDLTPMERDELNKLREDFEELKKMIISKAINEGKKNKLKIR